MYTPGFSNDSKVVPPFLIDHKNKRIAGKDLEKVIADAWRHGLLVAVERHGVAPGDLFKMAISRPDLRRTGAGRGASQRKAR